MKQRLGMTLMIVGLSGCLFSPAEGEWAMYGLNIDSDCNIEEPNVDAKFFEIRQKSDGIRLEIEEEQFDCTLDFKDFTCNSKTVDYDAQEVLLQFVYDISGRFEDRDEGSITLQTAMECVDGDCSTYGLSECQDTLNASIALSAKLE